MSTIKLIADSGATKTEWRVLAGKKKKTLFTQGISPYLMTGEEIHQMLLKELKSKLKKEKITEIFYYGTGCNNPENVKNIRTALKKTFQTAKKIKVENDIMSAAKGLCGDKKGMVVNLGTGSFCCYYNGKKIAKDSPGIGYILGDEGSGAYLGRKVIQHFLYKTFDEELMAKFNAKYATNRTDILNHVYRMPLANRYIASYTHFLSENRGHYMIENIIEDSLNEFFYTHLYKYRESWLYPIHFTGGVAFAFKDVIKTLCSTYELQLGRILKNPMQGLVEYHC